MELKPSEVLVIPKVEPFSYVNAKVVGGGPTLIRSGVYVANLGDGTVIVAGEEDIFHCQADSLSKVEDQNLFGSTKEFVENLRKANTKK